ncbi:MAG TPA: hypothetical protein VH083_05080 [Myxococcales bacterium]|jgi:hypothetical protein|nr:hypothetical protein [Myxococcales bacterium]
MVNAAEAALTAFKVPESTAAGDEAWKQYKLFVDRHGACADGVLGEFWDDLNIQMLGKQWEAALRFAPLQGDTAFRRFVERFCGSTSSRKDVDLVRKKAASQCTPRAAGFCKRIRKMLGV